MKIHKKTCTLLALLLMCACLLFSVTGCAPKMHEEGNFTYYTQKGNDGITYVHISELTELGKQQKILVIPEEIDGMEVCAIEKWGLWVTVLEWESENLEKVFLPTIGLNIDSSVFNNCVNLKKFILTVYDGANTSSFNEYMVISGKHGCYLNVPRKAFDQYILYLVSNEVISEEEAQDTTYPYTFARPANVSYYYNYDTDINFGYYWIDDVDYGGVIEYIPQDPVREGYEFGGWYKEAECINRWDFKTDILPEEQLEEVKTDATGNSEEEAKMITVYQETILYAKWINK